MRGTETILDENFIQRPEQFLAFKGTVHGFGDLNVGHVSMRIVLEYPNVLFWTWLGLDLYREIGVLYLAVSVRIGQAVIRLPVPSQASKQ